MERASRARSSGARVGALAGLLAACTVALPAAAERGSGLDASLGTGLAFVPYVPSLSVSPTVTRSRVFEQGTLPPSGSLFFSGLEVDSTLVYRGRLLVPLLGVAGALATGLSAAPVTSFDGATAEMRPWTAFRVESLLPGVGVGLTSRRWALRAWARAFVVALGMDAAVAIGRAQHDLSQPIRFGMGARAEVEVCRRLDPVDRLCAFVAPTIYEFEPLNGGSVGLRWELGP